jgi:hypothetical protein
MEAYLFKFFKFSNIDTLGFILTIFIQPIFNLLELKNQGFLVLGCDKITVLFIQLSRRKKIRP